jgi:putative ABC transport system permease protein
VDGKVYRTDLINPAITGGIGIYAASLELPKTLGATLASGTWLNQATANYPVAVLAHRTALTLGINHAGPDVRVLVGGQWFTVAGILNPMPLAESLDTAVFVGWAAAQKALGFDGHPTMIFTRSLDSQVHQVRDVLAYTANPAAPAEVKVSRPSDALAARAAADQTFTALLLGLGAVALLVGGIGVANTMVISVLERRGEIGLRRSLGATRGHIRLQFLTESLLLSAVGGFVGVVLGVAATTVYSQLREWPTVVPLTASGAGFGATLVVGVIAGLYPAARAARLSPTEALATS